MNIRKAILAGVAATTLALGTAVASGGPASAATYLGGVSYDQACLFQYFNNAGLVAENVFGWRCGPTTATWGWIPMSGVDLTRECVREYGSGAYASYSNYNKPFSWRCYR